MSEPEKIKDLKDLDVPIVEGVSDKYSLTQVMVIQDQTFRKICLQKSKELNQEVFKLFLQQLKEAIQKLHFMLDQNKITAQDVNRETLIFNIIKEYHELSLWPR